MTTLTNKRRFRSEKIAPYFFISPFYIIFTIFFLLPTIASFVLAFYKWKGEASGGTIETMFSSSNKKIRKSFSNPFMLNPKNSVSSFQQENTSDKVRINKNHYIDVWSGPFIMGATNASIVRRSAALLNEQGTGYGKNFIYNEYAYYASKRSAYIGTLLLVIFIFSIFKPK